MESMGKNDSYAFLEVFFGDRSSNNLSGMGGGTGTGCQSQKGLKHSSAVADNEDNEIGLSLEDESPSHPIKKEYGSMITNSNNQHHSSVMGTNNIGTNSCQQQIGQHQSSDGPSPSMETGTIKRAYDDALAARGLMSVSRSCEKLNDLVLPAKIQRTLSQEFISKQQQQQQAMGQSQYSQYSYTTSTSDPQSCTSKQHQQYPGQQPVEPSANDNNATSVSSTSEGHVQVSSSTKCMLCDQTNVDTQVRPCGHMFHERCLKPSLKTPMGPPKCPIDDIPMHSAVLAVPDNSLNNSEQQSSWSYSSTSTQSLKATKTQCV
jgi:hypothetical protein